MFQSLLDSYEMWKKCGLGDLKKHASFKKNTKVNVVLVKQQLSYFPATAYL